MLDDQHSRTNWLQGPPTGQELQGLLALDDDELLAWLETMVPGPATDVPLLEIVRSSRHFFIRQEAAKCICDTRLLRAWEDDRHVGQILVRRMTRREDVDYLSNLAATSRHVEVRRAAQAQLKQVLADIAARGPSVSHAGGARVAS